MYKNNCRQKIEVEERMDPCRDDGDQKVETVTIDRQIRRAIGQYLQPGDQKSQQVAARSSRRCLVDSRGCLVGAWGNRLVICELLFPKSKIGHICWCKILLVLTYPACAIFFGKPTSSHSLSCRITSYEVA